MSNKDIPTKLLTETKASEELSKLAKEIRIYDEAYYLNDSPLVPDYVYDALRKRNLEIEKAFPHLIHKDSPSVKVGITPQSGFSKIKHARSMLSLGNVFSEDDLNEFVMGIRRFLKELKDDSEIPIEMVAEPKIDGISVLVPKHKKNSLAEGQRISFGFRAEDIVPLKFGQKPKNSWSMKSKVNLAEPLGTETLIFTNLGNTEVVSRMFTPELVNSNDDLEFALNLDRTYLFDGDSGLAI